MKKYFLEVKGGKIIEFDYEKHISQSGWHAYKGQIPFIELINKFKRELGINSASGTYTNGEKFMYPDVINHWIEEW